MGRGQAAVVRLYGPHKMLVGVARDKYIRQQANSGYTYRYALWVAEVPSLAIAEYLRPVGCCGPHEYSPLGQKQPFLATVVVQACQSFRIAGEVRPQALPKETGVLVVIFLRRSSSSEVEVFLDSIQPPALILGAELNAGGSLLSMRSAAEQTDKYNSNRLEETGERQARRIHKSKYKGLQQR